MTIANVLAADATPPDATDPGPREWRHAQASRTMRLVMFGVLWGIVIMGLELPGMPITSTAARPWYVLLFYQSLTWIWAGLLLSLALWWSTRGEVRWMLLACLLPLVAVVNGLSFVLWGRAFAWLNGFVVTDPIIGQTASPTAVLNYVGWLTIIYGGVAALIYALRRRIDQTTAALQCLALARERNEAAIAEARVRAMIERIEPRFLLEVLDAARAQYADQADRAEATLNACTEFLRAAMPQLRAGRSTVAAELDLCEAYLALRDCMHRGRRSWRVDRRRATRPSDTTQATELACVPLPPMALLPVLDRMLADRDRVGEGEPLTIAVSAADASIAIRIGAPIPDALAHVTDSAWFAAISMRLLLVCGRDASIRTEGPASRPRALCIVIPTGASSEERAHDLGRKPR